MVVEVVVVTATMVAVRSMNGNAFMRALFSVCITRYRPVMGLEGLPRRGKAR